MRKLVVCIFGILVTLIMFIGCSDKAEDTENKDMLRDTLIDEVTDVPFSTTDIDNFLNNTYTHAKKSDRGLVKIKPLADFMLYRINNRVYTYTEIEDGYSCYDDKIEIVVYKPGDIGNNRVEILGTQEIDNSKIDKSWNEETYYIRYLESNRIESEYYMLCRKSNSINSYIENVYNKAKYEMEYDHDKGNSLKEKPLNKVYISNLDNTIENNKGICIDKAVYVVSLLRYNNIPSRVMYGNYKDKEHAWVQILNNNDLELSTIPNWVYTDNLGREWVNIEPTIIDNNKIKQEYYVYEFYS